jgi:hypothetical protein
MNAAEQTNEPKRRESRGLGRHDEAATTNPPPAEVPSAA